MNIDDFASTIKQKYPDYKDIDNTQLVNAIVAKHPEYKSQVDLAPQQPSMLKEGASAVANMIPVVGEAKQAIELNQGLSDASNRVGDWAQEMSSKYGAHPAVSKSIGFVSSMLSDPRTYIGLGPEAKGLEPAVEAVSKPVADAVESRLPAIYETLAKIPRKATEIASDQSFKLGPIDEGTIQSGAKAVQDALKNAVSSAGKALNSAKSEIGIPTTVAEKEASLGKFGNIYGIGKADLASGAPLDFFKDFKSPEELATTIAKFKKTADNLPGNLRAKVANFLQGKVNDFADMAGQETGVGAVLKAQYGDLKNILGNSSESLQTAKTGMAKALGVFDDLNKKLGDSEDVGKATDFIKKVFAGKNGKATDELNQLAKLEVMSGKPVLSDMFKNLASEAYSQWSTRPFLAVHGAGMLGYGLGGHPIAAATGAGLLAAQSPAMIKGATRLGYLAAQGAKKVASSPLAVTAMTKGLNRLSDSSDLQSIRDRMLNQ